MSELVALVLAPELASVLEQVLEWELASELRAPEVVGLEEEAGEQWVRPLQKQNKSSKKKLTRPWSNLKNSLLAPFQSAFRAIPLEGRDPQEEFVFIKLKFSEDHLGLWIR